MKKQLVAWLRFRSQLRREVDRISRNPVELFI